MYVIRRNKAKQIVLIVMNAYVNITGEFTSVIIYNIRFDLTNVLTKNLLVFIKIIKIDLISDYPYLLNRFY
jgi:hypothetical protein